ncbi:MAG: tRNA pseudouridine(38-40) synthase TruA [Bacteroidota bacterium]|nr:tRNA pseudouridine(38-40) synthase TruA [Bacteroidota bacterium]
MRNIKITVEYDGTDFIGWQRQASGRSVQTAIEDAIAQVTKESVAIIGAGRTDAGVHARGQTANFFLESAIAVNELHRALNGVLPEDIVIHHIEEAQEKFSARYSAKERIYRYYISHIPSALDRKFCWQVFYRLDFRKMNDAARLLLGTHDFQSFCTSSFELKNFECAIFEAEWRQQENSGAVFIIRANRFLHGMVRAIVGTLIDVGRGKISVEEFAGIVQAKDRRRASMAAPAKGLVLERVVY